MDDEEPLCGNATANCYLLIYLFILFYGDRSKTISKNVIKDAESAILESLEGKECNQTGDTE
jgi:hypothetical protein